MLVLYTGDRFFSSWSMRGRVMVVEKGLEFVERPVELDWPVNPGPDGRMIAGDGNRLRESCSGCVCDTEDLAAPDVEGLVAGSVAALLPRVPVLVDDGTGVVASDVLAIAEYLDEQFPDRPLLPSDAATRAAVRSLSAHLLCDLYVLLHEAPYAVSLRPGQRPPVPDGAAEQARWVGDVLGAVLARWGGEYLFGRFGLADVMLAPIAQQFRGWNLPAPEPVAAYFARLLERPSVAEHLAQARRPYELIEEAEPGSPQWTVRHYRYRTKAGLLHDWQANRRHELVGPVARRAVDLAYQGADLAALIATIAAEFAAPRERVEADLTGLFAQLDPAAGQEGSTVGVPVAG